MTRPHPEAPQGDGLRGGLTCFGAITAGVTHELSNLLATIDQSAGSLDDLSRAVAGGGPVDPQRLAVLHGRIARAVQRGVRTLRLLNRFAHSVDEPVGELDVREETETLVGLMQRHAAMRQVRLQAALPAAGLRVTADPFALQRALFLCVTEALAGTEPDGRVLLEAIPDEEGARLAITGATRPAASGQATSKDVLIQTLGSLGFVAARGRTTGGEPAVVLRLPRTPSCGKDGLLDA